MSDMTVDALQDTREKLEVVLGALADIAFSKDMTIELARAKAKRIYEECTPHQESDGAR